MKRIIIIMFVSIFYLCSCQNESKELPSLSAEEKKIELMPLQKEYEDEEDLVEYHIKKGLAFFEAEKYQKAIEEFDFVLNLSPSLEHIQYKKAVSQIAVGNYEESVILLTKLIETNSTEGKYFYFRGVAYSLLDLEFKAQEDWAVSDKFGYKN